MKNQDEMLRIKNHRVGAPPLNDNRLSNDQTHRFGVDCTMCGDRQYIYVPTVRFWSWRNGDGYIQNLMPELDADERECLKMGWCLPCVKSIYARMEEQMDEQLEEEDNNAT